MLKILGKMAETRLTQCEPVIESPSESKETVQPKENVIKIVRNRKENERILDMNRN